MVMDKEFLKLISCFLEKELSSYIMMDNKQNMVDIVDELNILLNISNSNEKFIVEDDNRMIGPVPFATNNSKDELDFVVFGLNPKFGNTTILEKSAAGMNWDDYSKFYTTEEVFRSLSTLGLFGSIVDNEGKVKPIPALYYPMIIEIISSINEKKYVTWKEFKNKNNPFPPKTIENLEKITENFLELIGKNNTLFAEMVPFHSEKFKLNNIHKLMSHPKYNHYITSLFNLINSKLSTNGFIVSNGKDSSEALEIMLRSGKFGSFETIKDLREEKKYSIHCWNKRIVLLCHQFLGYPGQYMKLASKEQRKYMLEDLINTTGIKG
jgi:hypothetical protein